MTSLRERLERKIESDADKYTIQSGFDGTSVVSSQIAAMASYPMTVVTRARQVLLEMEAYERTLRTND